jgi:Uma2 family endonuclease
MSLGTFLPSSLSLGPAVPLDPIWRFTLEQYHAMIRSGILTDDEPVEFLDGWLVPKMPKSRAHRMVTRLVREALERRIGAGWYVDSQEPISLVNSEPEPDVLVVHGQPTDYATRHPGPSDIALVVEVADTTLARDRGLKLRMYARAGVPLYWIVNLVDRQVEIFWQPKDGDEPRYERDKIARSPDEVEWTIDERLIRIPASELLGFAL